MKYLTVEQLQELSDVDFNLWWGNADYPGTHVEAAYAAWNKKHQEVAKACVLLANMLKTLEAQLEEGVEDVLRD